MDQAVIVGYDRRFLSENAAKWVAETLAEGCLKVWVLKRSAPTPLIMHTVKDKELHCIMVLSLLQVIIQRNITDIKSMTKKVVS